MKKFISILVVCLIGLQHMPMIGEAAETMAYSVKANIPENQINKTLTYFDLKMEPNQRQEITLTVSNSSDEKATILISPNVAMTNQNGVIDYSKAEEKVDSTLKNPVTSIISKAQEVTLEPKETKEVLFTIQMPEKEFDGLILGGFYISKKEDNENTKDKEKDVQIKNKYSYVIGLQLRENTNEVKPVMELNDIKPALLNYRTAVTANLQNTEATIMKEVSVDAKVMKKGTTKVLHETKKEGLSMAPNSNFDFPINWDNQSLDPGTYRLQLIAQSGEDKWEFEKEFKISAKDSTDLNKEAVELEKTEPNWILIISVVAGITIFLILVIGFFIYRHQKKKAAEKRARLLKQKKRKKQQELRKRKMPSETINKTKTDKKRTNN
ncbi:conserved exported hypothetical protein [Carnobacterium maltaromaticum]|uniref:DUF916 and DUF3324 domain-containing protein n=2 Tax=Carnobacterium maltaromaticum TaxID=2751 RepID=UPI00191B9131|nr:DUF916 and DUF3324 domain-containing protein [Carnobacterium maltaromaticum]CAD5901671.1 conserved exported hypothetical protein [Carnobacterium maltaromaticum]